MCLAWWQARLFGRGFELSSKGHEWDVSARDRTALMTWKSIWSGARNIATRPFSRMWRVVFETCFAKSVRPMTFRLSKAMWARITFISMFPILPNYPSVRWSSVWKVGLPKWSRLNFRNWEQSFGADTSVGYAAFSSGTVTDQTIQEYLERHIDKDDGFTVDGEWLWVINHRLQVCSFQWAWA